MLVTVLGILWLRASTLWLFHVFLRLGATAEGVDT